LEHGASVLNFKAVVPFAGTAVFFVVGALAIREGGRKKLKVER
jgi:hypothetical protein